MTDDCATRIRRGGWAEDAALGRCRAPIGPRNTWSNLAYAVAGTWLAWRYQDASSAALALALWLLATGSGLYHAYKTIPANRLDWLGMFATVGALVAHGIAPAWPGVAWAMVGLGGLAGYGYLSQRRLHFDLVIGAGIGLGALGATVHGGGRLALASLVVFALSYGCWQVDRHGLGLGRWGHALWHAGTAVAMGLLYVAQR